MSALTQLDDGYPLDVLTTSGEYAVKDPRINNCAIPGYYFVYVTAGLIGGTSRTVQRLVNAETGDNLTRAKLKAWTPLANGAVQLAKRVVALENGGTKGFDPTDMQKQITGLATLIELITTDLMRYQLKEDDAHLLKLIDACASDMVDLKKDHDKQLASLAEQLSRFNDTIPDPSVYVDPLKADAAKTYELVTDISAKVSALLDQAAENAEIQTIFAEDLSAAKAALQQLQAKHAILERRFKRAVEADAAVEYLADGSAEWAAVSSAQVFESSKTGRYRLRLADGRTFEFKGA